MTCRCDKPRESPDPRRAGWCANCLKQFDPHWLSTDATVREFFDRLEDAVPGDPEGFGAFREHVEARELAGRESFGIQFLTRDNAKDATEECGDAGVYAHLELLKGRRLAGEEADVDLLLEGARHAYLAHECFRRYRAKRHGSP